jgi:hypothetical protein
MAGGRDPLFWKRFSMAVHMDEEKGFPDRDLKSSYVLHNTTFTCLLFFR